MVRQLHSPSWPKVQKDPGHERQAPYMFGVDWNDPQTLWLNLTNFALCIATLAALGAFTYGLLGDLVTLRKRSKVMDNAGDEMRNRNLVGAGTGAHLMPVQGLGLTMADGGEPVQEAEKPQPGKGSELKPRKTE